MSSNRAATFTRWWVGLYTRGLDELARGERREEVACDVWEQSHDRPGASTGAAIVVRCLLGVPADLSWRAEQARIGELPARAFAGLLIVGETAAGWLNRRGLPGLTVLIAVLAIVLGVALIATAGRNENQTTGGAIAGGILFMVAGSFMLAGQQVRKQQPRAAALMITVGVLPVALVFFATGVFPVVALVVAAAAWRESLTQRRNAPTG